MAVHADSSIPTWVQGFNSAFYTSITDKEEWSLSQYDPILQSQQYNTLIAYFTSMANAMDTYRSQNRYDAAFTLIGNIYQYFFSVYNFGATPIGVSVDVNQLFSFGNFVDDTMSRPLEYYDDLVEVEPTPSGIFESVKLQADIDYLNNNAISDENAYMNSIGSSMNSVTQATISKALFEDVAPVGVPKGKQDAGVYIFEDLNFKFAVTQLDLSPLEIPSYITP